ncbi:MAG: glycosyltransferase family 4 protein [Elusimicrobia bacterium]|nr:glycosyltransferase family 4 protein [Elusimicrobiota bacterium]
MRVLLVAPSAGDPAHRRVLQSLGKQFARAGTSVSVHAPRSARDLERALARLRPDVCHLHYFSRGFAFLDRVRFPPGTNLVVTHQGASTSLLERPGTFRRVARLAARTTAVSRAGVRELRARFPELATRLACVPNGTDLPPSPARSARRPVVLAVGRVAAYKGIDILLMAFAGAARRVPGLRLEICGPDQMGGRMRRFARALGLDGKARFLGRRSPAATLRLMRTSLLLAHPSRRENMPMAVLEAMAAGLPVVATRVGGVPDAVAHGRSGLLVAPRDAAALERAIVRLSTDADLRGRLSAAARSRAERFSWSAVAARYRSLYADVLRERGVPRGRS